MSQQKNNEFRSLEQICEMIIKDCFNEDDDVNTCVLINSVPKIIDWLNLNYGFLNRENKIKLIIESTKMLSQKVKDIEIFYTVEKYINENLENYLHSILELEDKSKNENLNYDLEYNFIDKNRNVFLIIISFLIFMMGSYTALSLI